ncbi:NAD(P)-binding protein [Schizophyllum commune Loenen D]|nr:NAD(P)-binding protein [Schizophyllum commune Loenen D]
MSAGFKSIAVAGAQGSIGKAVLQGLTSTPGVSVLVLTRKTTPRPEWLPKEVAHAGVDYDDVDGTAAVLREHKIEAVVFPGSGILQQIPLADAAKAAGVQLFVPSEYGTVDQAFTLEEAPDFLAPKVKVAQHLEAIGLPSVRVYTGAFHDFALPLVGYTVNKKVNILKGLKGDTPMSITHTNDIGGKSAHLLSEALAHPIAGFIAYVVTHYSLSDLAFKSFRIEGGHLSFNELAALVNAPVEHVDEIPSNFYDKTFLAHAQTFVERGLLNTETKVCEGDGAGGANHLWRGHKWTTVKESLNLQ